MRDRKKKLALLEIWLQGRREFDKLWGTTVGLQLACCYYSDRPWKTVTELAKEDLLSEDTIRRKLDELVAIGRVKSRKVGNRKEYRAAHIFAEKTYQIVKRQLSVAVCNEQFP